MKLSRTQSVVEFKLANRFQNLRKKLSSEQFAQSREKPLAFWTVPNDRRLPLAFMSRTVGELLSTDFQQLYETPGVGHKKIAAMVDLLARVATNKDQPADEPRVVSGVVDMATASQSDHVALPGEPGFRASLVSESDWQQWRASVVRHGLEQECLGRFALSLHDLPRVVWNTPLATYTSLTLDEIRHLKTHGEKRVRLIVEAFGCLHRILGGGEPVGHLSVAVVPRFAREIEAWIFGVLQSEQAPSMDEIRCRFIEPLVEQTRNDAGEPISSLTVNRLGLDGTHSTVKQAAKQMGLTRARVYQLLNDVGEMMAVRWPEGGVLVEQLSQLVHRQSPTDDDLALFDTAVTLFFPSRPSSDAHNNGHAIPVEVNPALLPI